MKKWGNIEKCEQVIDDRVCLVDPWACFHALSLNYTHSICMLSGVCGICVYLFGAVTNFSLFHVSNICIFFAFLLCKIYLNEKCNYLFNNLNW